MEEAVGVYPSVELENIAEARPSERFGDMPPKVGRRQSPGRITPGTNFGRGVFYTQQYLYYLYLLNFDLFSIYVAENFNLK